MHNDLRVDPLGKENFENPRDSLPAPLRKEGKEETSILLGRVDVIDSTYALGPDVGRVGDVANNAVQTFKNTLNEEESNTQELKEKAVGSKTSHKKKSAVEALRNRKQTDVQIIHIRQRFAGHVAWAFLERKPGDKSTIHAIADERVDLAEKILKKNGLSGFEREDANSCTLGALALAANGDVDRKLSLEDIERAIKKADDLLKPQLKDKNGNKVDDKKFALIKEEIKTALILQLAKIGLIDSIELVKLQEKGKSEKSAPIDIYHANWTDKTKRPEDQKESILIVALTKKSLSHEIEIFALWAEMIKAIKEKKEELALQNHDIKVHEIKFHEIKRMILKEEIGKVQSAEVDLKQKHFEEVLLTVDGRSIYIVVEKKITNQSVAAA